MWFEYGLEEHKARVFNARTQCKSQKWDVVLRIVQAVVKDSPSTKLGFMTTSSIPSFLTISQAACSALVYTGIRLQNADES